MTPNDYTIAMFVEDAKRILGASGDDPRRAAAQLTPLMERVVWDDGLFDKRYLDPPSPAHPRPRYVHYADPDDALQIYVVEFAPETPTPVHDHMTWGLIGICGGAQHTVRYERMDDGRDPGRADLRLIDDSVLERGAVYFLLAPADIHSIETVGRQPSYSLHVIGGDLSRQQRHVFDVDAGTVAPFTGRSM